MLIPHLPACKCDPSTRCCYKGKQANARRAHKAGGVWKWQYRSKGYSAGAATGAASGSGECQAKALRPQPHKRLYWVCGRRRRGRAEDAAGRHACRQVCLAGTGGCCTGTNWCAHLRLQLTLLCAPLGTPFSARAAAAWPPSSCSRVGASTHRSCRFLHRGGRLAPLLLLHVPPNLALQLVEAGDSHEGVHGQQVVVHLNGTAVEG